MQEGYVHFSAYYAILDDVGGSPTGKWQSLDDHEHSLLGTRHGGQEA